MFRSRVPAAAGVAALTLSVGPLAFPASGAVPVAPAATDTTSAVVRDGVTLLRVRTAVDRSRVTGKGPPRSDFDGDGRDDLVFNSSNEHDFTAKVDAGGVWIVPGGPNGLDTSAA